MNYIVHSEFYKTPYCICRVKQPIQQVKCREGLDFWAGLEVMSVNYNNEVHKQIKILEYSVKKNSLF